MFFTLDTYFFRFIIFETDGDIFGIVQVCNSKLYRKNEENGGANIRNDSRRIKCRERREKCVE